MLELLIKAFIFLRLDFCNSLLIGSAKSLINKFQRIQNAAARMLSDTQKFDHITPVINNFQWLKVENRIKFKTLLICHNIIHGRAPDYLIQMFSTNDSQHGTRQAKACLLYTSPSPRDATLSRMPSSA